MPITRNEKIILVGGAAAAALVIGGLAAHKAGLLKLQPLVVGTQNINQIPPYVSAVGGYTVTKKNGNATGSPIAFSLLPGTSIGGAIFICDNPTALPTAGYVARSYDLTKYGNAKIILQQIGCYQEHDNGWATITGRLNIWNQNGVDDANWFTGSPSPNFLVGKDIIFGTTNEEDTVGLSIDVSNQKSLTVEAAFSGADFPAIPASAYMGPTYLLLAITEYVTVQVNIETDGGTLLSPNSATVTIKNSAGTVVGTGTTTTGTITFPNLLSDTFTITVTVGNRTDSQTVAVPSGSVIVTFSFLHPVATFTVSPSPATSGQTVTLDPSGTADPQGSISQETWLVTGPSGTIINETFAPGNPAFLKPTSYVTPAGSAIDTITLTVTNDAGLSSSVQHIENVVFFGSLSVFINDDLGNVYVGVEVDIYDGSNSLVAKAFSLGDGQASFNLAPGTYTVRAKLALNGAPGITHTAASVPITSGSTTSTVLVWNHPVPSFHFLSAPGITDVGATVTLDGSATRSGDVDANIFYAKYDWGDGTSTDTNNTGTLLTADTHVYTAATATSIKLTVINDAGLSASVVAGLTVSTTPIATMMVTPSNPVAGDSVTFNATFSGGTPGYNVLQVDFGDGQKSIFGLDFPLTHVYVNPGTYTVTLNYRDQVASWTATLSLVIGSTVVAHASRVYPTNIVYSQITPGVYSLTVQGVLAFIGDTQADGNDDILDASQVAIAFDHKPGDGSGLYDISIDVEDNGIIDILDVATIAANFDIAVPLQYINGQIVTIEVYSPSSGGWITLARVMTGVGTIPFLKTRITAQGEFQITQSNVASDITQIRLSFAGNAGLAASVSKPYPLGQVLRG